MIFLLASKNVLRMQPVGTRREREGTGRCAFVAGRVAGRGVSPNRRMRRTRPCRS
jgi:hypothetical protein